MNEPIFKNVFVRDEETIRELYRCYFFTNSRSKLAYILSPICLVIIFLENVSYDLTPFFIMLCIIVFVFLLAFIQYLRITKIAIKRNNELLNGEIHSKENLVFDDRIIQVARENSFTLLIENIKHVEITQNYIYVISKAGIWYDFKKDSFTLGTPEEFIEFLKSKGIKIQK